MKKKPEKLSTYDELMKDPQFKKEYKKAYRELVLSELLLAIMEEDNISIRSLAKQAGISPTIIQDLRSGKRDNLTLKTFSSLVDSLGYTIVLEKQSSDQGLPKRVKMKNMGQKRIRRRKKQAA